MENPLFEELLGVHAMIRRDLATVTLLAEDAAGGIACDEIRERLGERKSSSILWQLKYGCLRHCRVVHSHHNLEDTAIFPTLRRIEPELEPVIERLESEHRTVSGLLDEVERATGALDRDADPGAARARLVESLSRLGTVLLEHLAFEERSLETTLGRMASWRG